MESKIVLCSASKAEREEARNQERLCKHCFQIFDISFDLHFHKLHTCWYAPYQQRFCRENVCTCFQFWCLDQQCHKGFVTQFELDYHKKYTCWTTIPFHLSEEELKKKKFVCHKCKAKYATPGLLKHCTCDADKKYNPWRNWSNNDILCNIQPEYICILCNVTFESREKYNQHDC